MKFKELLRDISSLIHKINTEKQTLKFYREKSFSIPSTIYGEERINKAPNTKAPFEKWIYKAIEQEKVINDLEVKLINLEDKVIDFLNRFGNIEFLEFIPLRYFDRLTFSEIAIKMNISRSKTYKIKDKIEEKLMNLEVT